MQCSSPIEKSRTCRGTTFEYSHRCGQCMACRLTRRSEWTARIILEASLRPHNAFITLTYEDMPAGNSLDPRHLQNFMKRLRFNHSKLSSDKIRFFAVGEYGDKTERPHYHAILFGYYLGMYYEECLKKSWPYGFIQMSPFTIQRACYIAGYTVKKMTAKDAFSDGRHPEFSRMSNQPGIGCDAVPNLLRSWRKYGFNREGSDELSVSTPSTIRIQGRVYPLDLYLQAKMLNLLQPDEVGVFTKMLTAEFRELRERRDVRSESHLESLHRQANIRVANMKRGRSL